MNFIDDSEWRRRRFAPLVLPLVAAAAWLCCAVFALGILQFVFHISKVPPRSEIYVFSAAMAMASGFGLWRYGGLDSRQSLLAVTTLLLVEIVLGESFVRWIAPGRGNAPFLFNVTMASLALVAVLMFFSRRFRNLYVAILLPGAFIVALRMTDSISNGQGYLDFIVWCAWFALLGYQLGKPTGSAVKKEPKPMDAAVKLALLTFLSVGIIGSFANVTIVIAFNSVQPVWWWLVSQVGVAAVMTVTLGFGLRNYRDLDVNRGLLAALVIFILEFVPSTILLGILLSHKMPLIEGTHWTGAILFASCTCLALALLDRTFRKVSVWFWFTILFTGPYAAMVWLADSGRVAISTPLLDLLILIMASLWVASIGYWLQRATLAKRAVSGASAQGMAEPSTSGPVVTAAPA